MAEHKLSRRQWNHLEMWKTGFLCLTTLLSALLSMGHSQHGGEPVSGHSISESSSRCHCLLDRSSCYTQRTGLGLGTRARPDGMASSNSPALPCDCPPNCWCRCHRQTQGLPGEKCVASHLTADVRDRGFGFQSDLNQQLTSLNLPGALLPSSTALERCASLCRFMT